VALSVGDICHADLAGFDTIVLLDVLHYIPYAQQDALLARIAATLRPGERLILRVGNAHGGWRFRYSQWVDRLVARAHGLRLKRLYGRPAQAWENMLRSYGFAVVAQPMSDGTLFANVLLVATAGASDCVK
jgi:O-methyltransferase involved in polyketide biosynthesis